MHVDELRDACVGLGIVDLGVSGVKTGRKRRLGTLAGVSSKQLIWDRGWGALLSVSPLLWFSEHMYWGITCIWRT
jgi:hypothetical protein